MEPSKIYSIFLICMLFISSATPIFGCGSCGNPPPKKNKPGSGYKSPKGPIVVPPVIIKPPIGLPPIGLPPVINPPIGLPPIVKPPVTLPPVYIPPVKPPIDLPPVYIPPVKPPIDLPPVYIPPVKPPVTLPPVYIPPVTVPPITTKPSPSKQPCPPSGQETCPIDTLKLGGCVNLLGGMVHIGAGDAAANECCPVLSGMAEMEAAVCLCTTLKIKSLNLNIYVPIAFELLITCGKTPPPGYTCSL